MKTRGVAPRAAAAVLLVGAASAALAGPAAADDSALITDTSVVLASGTTGSPDALSAGPLASALGDGLLLTDPAHLSGAAQRYIATNRPATVVIVGGPAAIATSVEAEIKAASAGVTVRRVYGKDRYETAEASATLVDWLYQQYTTTTPSTA